MNLPGGYDSRSFDVNKGIDILYARVDTTVMKNTTDTQIKDIEQQASKGFGYSPIKPVKCPHCGATMQAIDAKAHVYTMAK